MRKDAMIYKTMNTSVLFFNDISYAYMEDLD